MGPSSSEAELTEFEDAKAKFLTFVTHEFFKHRLRPPTEFPLHEIMVYGRINEVKSTFVGAPRATVCCALSNPADFLNVRRAK